MKRSYFFGAKSMLGGALVDFPFPKSAGDLLILGQVLTFLLLICPRQGWYKEQGRHTLGPYLLHHLLIPSAKLELGSMEFPGSLNRWDRYHIITPLARTISGI